MCYYPESKKLVVINNSGDTQKTVIKTAKGDVTVELAPFATKGTINARVESSKADRACTVKNFEFETRY